MYTISHIVIERTQNLALPQLLLCLTSLSWIMDVSRFGSSNTSSAREEYEQRMGTRETVSRLRS